MMRIDAHQHFWVYDQREYAWIDDSMASLRRDFLPNDLKPELERNGFQGSVVVQARQTLEETRWLLELATDASFILGVVGWVDLRSPDVRSQLEAFAGNPKLVGIRHIAQSEPNDRFLLQPEFLRGISLLGEFDLAYDILIYPKHLPVAAEFVRRFPRQRFVLDHLAKPLIKSGNLRPWERGMRELGTFPNVFCKLSGLVTEDDWLDTFQNPDEKLAAVVAKIPLGKRTTTAEEIAAMTVFLISAKSGHTNGQHVFVDGGYVHLDRALT
jgi:L-fuconolactonase